MIAAKSAAKEKGKMIHGRGALLWIFSKFDELSINSNRLMFM